MSKALKQTKVFVAMSGGVDSSVAAYLLKKSGYDVVGVFIRSYNIDGCAERDAEDARKTAQVIGIPFYVFDFEKEYREQVVDYMIDGYKSGITPNPDIMCNKHIKFGAFLEKARAMGADYIATGHHVRIRENKNGIRAIVAAKDTKKDQSYFLWTLTQRQLAYCLFPVGKYTKPHIRAIAKQAGLPTAEKKDSQGICFLGKVALNEFLGTYIPKKEGVIVTTAGEQIGTHDGAFLYTIGQRHLGTKNLKTASEPYYVVDKDAARNTLVMAKGDDTAHLTEEVALTDINLMAHGWETLHRMPVLVRIRYRQQLVSARIMGENRIRFAQPQKFVAPGQSAVIYKKPLLGALRMIGGGVIAGCKKEVDAETLRTV